jgi:vacuolar-type H+-ATPase subunit H
MYGVLHGRQTANACAQSKKSVEQAEKTRRQMVEQANREARDAEATAER